MPVSPDILIRGKRFFYNRTIEERRYGSGISKSVRKVRRARFKNDWGRV